VVRGEKEYVLNVNESIFIPLGEKHKLSNPHEDMLEVIEVQSGDYLGEDDIIRFGDIYGRTTS
jgi:mannose-6-phosphate isomerase-like protein (cupin superfamily)